MKKNFSVIFIFLAFIMSVGIFGGYFRNNVFAEGVEDNKINCKAYYLADANSKTEIYANNELKHLPIASMCKIMTLLLCFEGIDNNEISLNEDVVVSENASKMGGSQIFLELNGVYKIEDLIKGIVVASANDACVAMAEKLCGSQSDFVEKMNAKALELNMQNTNFVNCTGLPAASQYSCAKDVFIMFSELLKHEEYFNFSSIWMDKISHPEGRYTEISNTNKLVRFYDGCDSGKTGYTAEAGHCLCASAIRDNLRLVSVVIGAPNSKERFKGVSSMFNYGFANYYNKLIVDDVNPLDVEVNVIGGKKKTLSVVAENPLYIFSRKKERKSYEFSFEPIEKIVAPINKGFIVGKLVVYENNVEVCSVNVIANENIEKKTYFDNVSDIINDWSLIS